MKKRIQSKRRKVPRLDLDEKIILLFQKRGVEISVIVIIALMATRFTLFVIGGIL